MHFYIQLRPSISPSGIRWLAFSRFKAKQLTLLSSSFCTKLFFFINFTHYLRWAYRILFGIQYYQNYGLLFPDLLPKDALIKFFLLYKVFCLLILHIVRAWRNGISTTESCISYFPIHSRTIHLINFLLKYNFTKVFFIRILHIVSAGCTEC